jgi:hypothetical protein
MASSKPSTEQPKEAKKPSKWAAWLEPESTKRRLLIALGVYAVSAIVFFSIAGLSPERLTQHTPFNHYAHLADAWLHGRQDLANGEPRYAGGNDFAHFEGKTYISFPPFPAVLMMPMVALAGSPEAFQDGQFIFWLAGIGPAILFLVLEKLRREKRSERSEIQNVALSLLFGFGTVYFFSAVQGTVWFAAHVVAVGLLALYLLFGLSADRPILAGTMMGFLFLTRPQCLLASILFLFEAIRVTCKDQLETEGTLTERIKDTWDRVDKPAFWKKIVEFSIPVALCLAIASWMNWTRFHNPSPNAFGHQYLTVAWQQRMAKWGLFGYHYFPKNLGIMLSSLPWFPPKAILNQPGVPLFQVNEHGLALWFTSPFYFWLLWPRNSGRGFLHSGLWLAALGPIVFDLLYQNSGWRQFGYRFSNDYAPILFVLLAIGGRSLGTMFKVAAAWALAVNTWGAISFDRMNFDKYYWRDGSQKILYQDD